MYKLEKRYKTEIKDEKKACSLVFFSASSSSCLPENIIKHVWNKYKLLIIISKIGEDDRNCKKEL